MDMNTLTHAASGGFDRISSALGGSKDPELAMYEKLTPDHFRAIVKEYGITQASEYINHMEFKRLQNATQKKFSK